ncbi:MAG TPA: hypothetical protein PL033_19795 [Candidatus Brocadiia bacterium]|nr:hypothetical protein [Candidatus Brocadiia bacterium]
MNKVSSMVYDAFGRWEGFSHGPACPAELRDSVADISPAHELLG